MTSDAFLVRDSGPLHGEVVTGGAKNSALKLVAAALLAEGRSVIENVPEIDDIAAMADVAVALGAEVSRPEPHTIVLDVPPRLEVVTHPNLVGRLRASIVVLGPLLAREGRARLAMPGGCNLGNRSIDLHLAGLAKLGAEISYGADAIEARVDGRLRGADIELPFASVGATENLLQAAVTARGVTRISNAAREPEISDLAAFLRAMGGDIQGDGTSEIVVRGVDALAPAHHRVIGDRIEAGTFAVGAALTGGDVHITDVDPSHLHLPLEKLSQMGADVFATDRGFRVRGTGGLRALDIVTLPYPGFPTDLQPQFLALLSQAQGTAIVTENVFDGRFSIVSELERLGAEIELQAHHAVVRGPRALSGAIVAATDLRAGAALVLAGLAAEGTTVVQEARHVDRGYADLAARLTALGADVERRVDDRVAVSS
ncbi:UDP-N-acetylglucosamine 1-carboxyvinyltransferase [Egibacter rhizosphaerae]|uniref:UDP-N-acetylglucosamine 1-carboxyvinyltransferase n=1 Tax=Egibacter rhizosphaerae TaxID=1670831 RepID=A0A411YCZ6_9ACTN|nr:UDP-N-acetylglucosamine 1-carboxyvinyltransferase [Egibacter rhizosphaerae]QBI19113.1 UDP-N-acetylglucosamine 1-carboxyvinyltransferase [Egibacter rhizosphaerae]